MVTNVNLAVIQGDQLWATDVDYTAPIAPTVAEHPLGQGDQLAVAVRLVVLQPPGGAKDNSIATAAAAVALAVGIRDRTRRIVKDPRRVHLFLAGPMGLSLLLGHRWNRVAPTAVYEEVRRNTQYYPAFEVSA